MKRPSRRRRGDGSCEAAQKLAEAERQRAAESAYYARAATTRAYGLALPWRWCWALLGTAFYLGEPGSAPARDGGPTERRAAPAKMHGGRKPSSGSPTARELAAAAAGNI